MRASVEAECQKLCSDGEAALLSAEQLEEILKAAEVIFEEHVARPSLQRAAQPRRAAGKRKAAKAAVMTGLPSLLTERKLIKPNEGSSKSHADADKSDVNESHVNLSDYELLRKKNMRVNGDMLRTLGLKH